MNTVNLVGRLTREPELRRTRSGEAVATFTLAVNRIYKTNDGQDADFISIVTWKKLAENVNLYCEKGSLVGVEGSLRTRSYEDKIGRRVYVTEVLASHVHFLGSKKDSGKDDRTANDRMVDDSAYYGITDEDIQF